MKIFRITENSNFDAGEIYWYMLADSSVVRTDNPWFVPDFDTEFRISPAVAVRIDRLGKSISPKFAPRYYKEATLCATACGSRLLADLKSKGLPWDRAVSFDRSCMIGKFIPISAISAEARACFHMGSEEIKTEVAGILDHADNTIAAVSSFNTLKTGDIIILPFGNEYFTPLPGDTLTAKINPNNLLEIRIK